MRRGFTGKTVLLPEEKLHAAHLHQFWGLDMQTRTAVFQVNPGRIAEAIKDVYTATGLRNPPSTKELAEGAVDGLQIPPSLNGDLIRERMQRTLETELGIGEPVQTMYE